MTRVGSTADSAARIGSTNARAVAATARAGARTAVTMPVIANATIAGIVVSRLGV